MKKNTFLIAIVIVAISIVSCKKDRTCTCKSTGNTVSTSSSGNSFSYTTTDYYKNTAENQTKKYFRKNTACYNKTIKSTDVSQGQTRVTTTETTCTLK